MNDSSQWAPILVLEAVGKAYATAHGPLQVLEGITFALQGGTTAAIVGPSGSGKTTLLGLCAGLDTPSAGQVNLDRIDLASLDEDGRARLRNEVVGFVFQNFQLMPTLTALENVMVPLELRGERGVRDRAAGWLERVGLGKRLDHYPVQLSGGEQQRVALARAFINEPKILFADEPTGNLDGATGGSVEDLLFSLNRDTGTTLVLVTHDRELARRCEQVLPLANGRLARSEPETELAAP
ncbi:MAG: ABC transporter ATP-binding protein [Opitutales bacterium]